MSHQSSESTTQRSGMPPLWLLALTLATFATGTDDMVIAGLLPEMSSDLDVSEAAVGQLVTVYSLTYGLGAPLMAMVIARFTQRRVLLAATALFTLTNLAMAAAPSYPVLMAVRVGAALAAAVIGPAALAAAAGMAPPERKGRYLSLVTAGLTVSLVAGVPIGTWIGGFMGWRATMLFVALLGGLSTVGMLRLPHGGRPPHLPLRDRFAPLRKPTVLTITAGLVISGAGGMMSFIYLAPLVRHLTGGTQALALLIMVFGVSGIAGVLLGGRGSDLWGSGRTLALSIGTAVAMLSAIALLGAAPVAGSLPFAALAAITVIWALGIWAFAPPLQAWLLRRSYGADSAILALQTSGMYLGFSLSGALGGVVLATWGPVMLPAASAGLLLLGGLVFIAAFTVLARREDRAGAGSAEPAAEQHPMPTH